MDPVELHALIFLGERQSEIVQQVKVIQHKLRQFSNPYQTIRSRYEIIMFDFLQFTVSGIDWNMAIQLQEVLEEIEQPVLFFGSTSSITDTKALKQGRFDFYFKSLLSDPDKLSEFLMFFLPFTPLLDYCLIFWRDQFAVMEMNELQYLKEAISYSPLQSILTERIDDLNPIVGVEREKQRSLDEFF